MKHKIITFGELMLRLSPDNNERFTQAHSYEAVYGGGEANTAVSLANFNVNVSYVTKLPEHTIGQSAVNSLRQYGVGVEHIVRGGEQIGIYFLEKKTSQRPTNVIYNRKGSAFALANVDDFDWDSIFADATWFHFSGITPAISDNMAQITLLACKKANKVMSEICKYVDICIANEDDAVGIFGLDASNSDKEKNSYIAEELIKMFPNFKMVASVWRTETSITTFKLQSMIYTEGKAYYSQEFFMNILDYIGAGDAYCAGIIYSFINDFDPQKAVEFSNAASCLKHTVSGDYNLVSVDEVMKLAFAKAGNEVSR